MLNQVKKTVLMALGVVALTASSMTFAAEPVAPTSGSPNPNMRGGMPGYGGMFGYVESMHKELKLSADQEKAWQEASQKTRDYMNKTHQEHWADMQAVRDEFKKETPDINALAKKHDAMQDAHLKAYRDIRDQWLHVYNNLNADQKQKLNGHMKKFFERMDQHGNRHAGGNRSGMRPGMPAAAPTQK